MSSTFEGSDNNNMHNINFAAPFRWRVVLSLSIGYLLGMSAAFGQRTAVKGNLLYWATGTPSFAVETRLSPRWTGELSVGYKPFMLIDRGNRKWKHILVQTEVRRWFCAPYEGHFFAANLMVSHYNVGNVRLPFGIWPELADHRYQGNIATIGVGYGYSWLLSPRWSIEAEATVGYGITHYDRYECKVCGTRLGTETKHLLMPTRLALTLVYNLR